MTDDQGHNDTAVPPKTTSAKEAALPLATTTREIYSTYMICMSRHWEKYSGKIQNILEYMLRSNKKWSTCTKEEAIVNNNDINIYKYTNVCTTPRENHIEHIISISFYKPWEWELCYHTYLPVSNRLITLGKQKDDEIQWVKKNRKWKRRHHCFHDLAELTQSL